LFLRSPFSDPRVGSAPFPLFSRVILAPVFGCANPGPTTLSNRNHEIKMTGHAVQADDQGYSGQPQFLVRIVDCIRLAVTRSCRAAEIHWRFLRKYSSYYYYPEIAEGSS
jgi:hypothetical protein